MSLCRQLSFKPPQAVSAHQRLSPHSRAGEPRFASPLPTATPSVFLAVPASKASPTLLPSPTQHFLFIFPCCGPSNLLLLHCIHRQLLFFATSNNTILDCESHHVWTVWSSRSSCPTSASRFPVYSHCLLPAHSRPIFCAGLGMCHLQLIQRSPDGHMAPLSDLFKSRHLLKGLRCWDHTLPRTA